MQHFDFRFDPKWATPLRFLGVKPATTRVDVGNVELLVRFGPWRVSTRLSNIENTQVTTDYTPLKAFGPRMSVSDRGLSFGTNADAGLCICFKEPIRGLFPTDLVKHPAVTVTVADPDGLARALEAANAPDSQ